MSSRTKLLRETGKFLAEAETLEDKNSLVWAFERMDALMSQMPDVEDGGDGTYVRYDDACLGVDCECRLPYSVSYNLQMQNEQALDSYRIAAHRMRTRETIYINHWYVYAGIELIRIRRMLITDFPFAKRALDKTFECYHCGNDIPYIGKAELRNAYGGWIEGLRNRTYLIKGMDTLLDEMYECCVEFVGGSLRYKFFVCFHCNNMIYFASDMNAFLTKLFCDMCLDIANYALQEYEAGQFDFGDFHHHVITFLNPPAISKKTYSY